MSRKRTARKYRPSLHPLDAITACLPFPDTEIVRILLKVHDAFAALCAGGKDPDLFDRMAAVLNVGMVRCEAIGQAGVDVFREAQQALMAADRIFGEHGHYGFTGPSLEAMRRAISLYEDILSASTPRQMAHAQDECMRRVRAGQYEQAQSSTTAAEAR